MTDTKRTLVELLAQAIDDEAGGYTMQDLRDFMVSVYTVDQRIAYHRSIDLQLDHSEILALRATPYVLIPGVPGFNIMPLVISWWVNCVAGAYTAPGGTQDLWLSGASVLNPLNAYFTHSNLRFAILASPGRAFFTADDLTPSNWVSADGDNDPLATIGDDVVLVNTGTAEYGGGNATNTVSCHAEYLLIPAEPFGGD